MKNTESQNPIQSEKESVKITDVIAETALKTLFWLVVFSALLGTLFLNVFPKSAVTFYENLGNTKSAYVYSIKNEKLRSGAELASAKYKTVSLSIKLMRENPKKYAANVEEATKEFYLNPDCKSYIDTIDKNNLKNSEKLFHPSVYSYKEYLFKENARAGAILGYHAIFTDATTDGYITFEGALINLVGITFTKDEIIMLSQVAVIFSNIETVITQFDYDLTKELYDKFTDYNESQIKTQTVSDIELLFSLKVYKEFSLGVTRYLVELEDKSIEDFSGLLRYGDEVITAEKAYARKLSEYVSK